MASEVSDPFALLALGRYDHALQSIKNIEQRRSLTAGEQVLLMELFSLTGDVDAALSTSASVLRKQELSVSQRCRLHGAFGLSYFRKGANAKGTEQYVAGIALAEQCNLPLDECRLRVHLFRNQIHWLGPHSAAADLMVLRRKVLNLADPAIAATFQLALTELAAKLGLLPRARKHLENARALVLRVEDKAIHADLMLVETALTALDGDLREALRHGLELAPILQESGYAAKFTLPINLGHLLSAQLRFDEALEVLQRALTERKFGGGGGVAILDTLMQLRLFQNDIGQAEELSVAIQKRLDEGEANDSYSALLSLLTRVKWLYRAGRWQEGREIALNSIPLIERVADRSLLERMSLLAAEGEGRAGNDLKGVEVVASAWRANPDPSLETLAEVYRVLGRLASLEDAESANVHFGQASRILEYVGNLAGRAEVQRDAIETSASEMSVAPHSKTDGLEPKPCVGELTSTAAVIGNIATLMEVGSTVPLLASEALALIGATGAAVFATITATDPGGVKVIRTYSPSGFEGPPDEGVTVRVALGNERGRDYELIVSAPPTATARITIFSIERLIKNAVTLARARQLEREQAALWPEQTPERQLGLICASERMLDLVKTLRRVAAANITVLLTGETGVGKELFARALHQASSRHDKVFQPFNCATVPREMFDSQLFGHRRGAFTGATDDSPGVIRAAAGGTLFLDEIGEMSLDTQPKLLRFLESGEIMPLGDPRPQLVDVRMVAATNANLDQLVAEGRFREDLYYRLNVIRINIPPLRERREEVPALVEHFLERFGRELQKPQLRVADETLEYLVLYRWPGNVRQLSNEIRRLVALAEPGSVLMPAHLSDTIAASRKTIPTERPALHSTEVLARLDQPLSATVEHVERAAIQRAVTVAEGNLVEAAKMLGLSRKGLYLKRSRLGLE